MPRITQRQAIVAALTARGSTVVPGNSRRYIVLTRPDGPLRERDGKTTKYFVGKAGALRIGHSASDSFPASDVFVHKLLIEGGYRS